MKRVDSARFVGHICALSLGSHMHKTYFLLIVSGMVVFAATIAARQDTKREHLTVKEVMVTMTIPASDAIFAAAAELQKDPKLWQEARQGAVTLAESGNLLITGGRAKDDTAWADLSRALVTQAQTSLKVIDAKDDDALAQAADDLYVTCKACHDRFAEK